MGRTFLLAVLGIFASTASLHGQVKIPERTAGPVADFSVAYAAQQTNYTYGGGFWMQGGSADAALSLYRGLGVALDLTAVHFAGDAADTAVSTLAYTAGPRYTWSLPSRWQRSRLYGEALFGGVHGFDASFPTANRTDSSADALATQVGGGYDVDWKGRIAFRVIEADYVRTRLPNGATGTQDGFKVGAGIVFRVPVR